jgi:hypothetical protein
LQLRQRGFGQTQMAEVGGIESATEDADSRDE